MKNMLNKNQCSIDGGLDEAILSENLEKVTNIIKNSMPNNPEFLACAFYNTGNRSGHVLNNHNFAILLYKEALDLNVERYVGSSIFNNIATEYKRMKNWDMARKYYLKAVSFDPKYLKALIRLAIMEAYMGNMSKAAKYYNDYINKGGMEEEAMYIMDNTDEGGKELKQFIENNFEEQIPIFGGLFSEEGLGFLNKGISFSSTGEYEKAIDYYDKAIDILHNDLESYKKEHDMIDAEITVDNSPEALAFFNKALALLRIGRKEEAFECQDMAIKLDPNNENYE